MIDKDRYSHFSSSRLSTKEENRHDDLLKSSQRSLFVQIAVRIEAAESYMRNYPVLKCTHTLAHFTRIAHRLLITVTVSTLHIYSCGL